MQQKLEQATETITNTMASLEQSEKSTEEAVCQQYSQIVKTQPDRQKDASLIRQKELLQQRVKEIAEKKRATLNAQLDQLEKLKKAREQSVKFAKDSHGTCTPVEFLSLWTVIRTRLVDLKIEFEFCCEPKESDIINFVKNEDSLAAISDAIGNVFADSHPEAFTVDDLDHTNFTENKTSTLTVTCRDIIGSRLSDCRHELTAEIQPKDGSNAIPCRVLNNHDGTYTITVEPRTHGCHTVTISVTINNKLTIYIRKEPFIITVAPGLV